MGLFTTAFYKIYDEHKASISKYDIEQVRNKMVSPEFLISWTDVRACTAVAQGVDSGSSSDKVLSALCFTGGLTKAEIEKATSIKESGTVIADLLSTFKIVENRQDNDESRFDFPSPLIQECFLKHKYGVTINSTQRKLDFDSFISEVLSLMDGVTLRNCFSKSGDGHLLEAAYQKEFYGASTQLFGNYVVVLCEVGSLFFADGFIHFWINNMWNWAIELLRNGGRLKEHVKRMGIDGKYKVLTTKAAHTLVIDLHEQ